MKTCWAKYYLSNSWKPIFVKFLHDRNKGFPMLCGHNARHSFAGQTKQNSWAHTKNVANSENPFLVLYQKFSKFDKHFFNFVLWATQQISLWVPYIQLVQNNWYKKKLKLKLTDHLVARFLFVMKNNYLQLIYPFSVFIILCV